jgi:hypothetical protein
MVVISKRGYSTREAAEYIGKSVAWLRQKRTRGPEDPGDPGPAWIYTEGGSVTYLREHLDAWLDGLAARAPQADKTSHERMLLARQAKEAKRLTAKGSQ